jgi:hypothetical protein
LKTKTITLPALEAGQTWALSTGFLKVTRVGKRLVDYKLLNKPEERGAANKIASIESVQAYLAEKRAVLQ